MSNKKTTPATAEPTVPVITEAQGNELIQIESVSSLVAKAEDIAKLKTSAAKTEELAAKLARLEEAFNVDLSASVSAQLEPLGIVIEKVSITSDLFGSIRKKFCSAQALYSKPEKKLTKNQKAIVKRFKRALLAMDFNKPEDEDGLNPAVRTALLNQFGSFLVDFASDESNMVNDSHVSTEALAKFLKAQKLETLTDNA